MQEVPVRDDHDYVSLLHLASCGLDGDSTFRLRSARERLRREAYGYPDGVREALPRPHGHHETNRGLFED
jgi:hypothetical protein